MHKEMALNRTPSVCSFPLERLLGLTPQQIQRLSCFSRQVNSGMSQVLIPNSRRVCFSGNSLMLGAVGMGWGAGHEEGGFLYP